jgi:hypothetical protein
MHHHLVFCMQERHINKGSICKQNKKHESPDRSLFRWRPTLWLEEILHSNS